MHSARPSLEDLAYRFGTDKSHDDHKYTDLYANLFDPIRDTCENFTEIGTAAGQSLQMWRSYFTKARIWGIEMWPPALAFSRKLFAKEPRVRVLEIDSKARVRMRNAIKRYRIAEQSMDVILDDGDHYDDVQHRTLLQWWKFLKPGGIYIIEDIATGGKRGGQHYAHGSESWKNRPPGYSALVHNASYLHPNVTRIFDENDVYFVDTQVGHRDLDRYQGMLGTLWFLKRGDRVSHLSHVLVIRRRLQPRTRPVKIFTGTIAMKGVFSDTKAQREAARRYVFEQEAAWRAEQQHNGDAR